MNRNLLLSLVGLGVISEACFAGSNGARASATTNDGKLRQAPVVVVTHPDGQCVVARCVNVSACDPASKGRSGPSTFTFTTAGGGAACSSSGQGTTGGSGLTAVAPQSSSSSCSSGSNGLVGFGAGSNTGTSSSPAGSGPSCTSTTEVSIGSGAASSGVFTLRTSPPKAPSAPSCAGPATDAAAAEGESTNLFSRIIRSGGAKSPAGENADESTRVIYAVEPAEPVEPAELAEVFEMAEFPAIEIEPFGEEVQRALEEARERLRENQDNAREAWQRASEQAREAQERAREAYEEAMASYQEAMQAAEERTRAAQERVLVERRAQADRKSWTRQSRSGSGRGQDGSLTARIDKLEAAARARGVDVAQGDRSLEERVAQLERLMSESKNSLLGGVFERRDLDEPAINKVFRGFQRRGSNALAPTPPVAPIPPSAANKLLREKGLVEFGSDPTAPIPPAAPGQGALQMDEKRRIESAMSDLKKDAARLREELERMRAEVERLPRREGAR